MRLNYIKLFTFNKIQMNKIELELENIKHEDLSDITLEKRVDYILQTITK